MFIDRSSLFLLYKHISSMWVYAFESPCNLNGYVSIGKQPIGTFSTGILTPVAVE